MKVEAQNPRPWPGSFNLKNCQNTKCEPLFNAGLTCCVWFCNDCCAELTLLRYKP